MQRFVWKVIRKTPRRGTGCISKHVPSWTAGAQSLRDSESQERAAPRMGRELTAAPMPGGARPQHSGPAVHGYSRHLQFQRKPSGRYAAAGDWEAAWHALKCETNERPLSGHSTSAPAMLTRPPPSSAHPTATCRVGALSPGGPNGSCLTHGKGPESWEHTHMAVSLLTVTCLGSPRARAAGYRLGAPRGLWSRQAPGFPVLPPGLRMAPHTQGLRRGLSLRPSGD